MRGRVQWVVFVLAAVLVFPAAARAAQPNLLFILTDDQRRDTLSVMPATRYNFDFSFKTAVVTTPDCCPSRASILTGEYAHNHGVTTNWNHEIFSARDADSLGPWLRQHGYYTGFIGKYLNRYHLNEAVPPGWDEFHARVWDQNGLLIGDGYRSFALREFWREGLAKHNDLVYYPNARNPDVYATRLFASMAARFIRRAHDPKFNPKAKPWALLLWPTAPHVPLVVEERYETASVPSWDRPPSYLEEDMTDKPPEVNGSTFRKDGSYPFARQRSKILRMLMSVDDLVDRVWSTVDDFEERKSTWGFFTSDNGRFLGEHWLSRKYYGYEESIRVPFRLAVPGRGAGIVDDALVANIDIAPTLLDLAGGDPRQAFDGHSLVQLVLDHDAVCPCPRTVLIENWEFADYQAVRNRRWKYVLWPSGNEELYDLRQDPYELLNVARLPKYNDRIIRLRSVLVQLAES
jgi:N-acetylglucosamine-6-sulfatase